MIIEDHPLYKQALSNLLRMSFPENEVAAFSQLEETAVFLKEKSSAVKNRSVALVDLTLPGLSGLEMINKIHTDHPDIQIVVISGSEDPIRVGACFGSGAIAFINKDTPPDRIVELISKAMRKGINETIWLNANGTNDLENVPRIHLTTRQIEVLNLISKGYTNKKIAEHTKTVEATAKAHVSAILRELGVSNRTQALIVSQKLGVNN
jgi:DNA-binding NarL/FixJ family response regulator